MTHEEAYQQICNAMPHLDHRCADAQGRVFVEAMIQFYRDPKTGELTRAWTCQRLDIKQA